jgi:predicted GNAT family acetyltransferase
MHIQSTGSVADYATAVTPFLEKEPCARNVLLSVIDSVRATSSAYSAPPSFWWVDDSGAVVGAASWTPPYQILVSSMPLEAVPAIAAAMIERAAALGIDPPGVNGPEVAAGAVASAWAAATGDTVERERVILLNELGHLVDVPTPPGGSRKAALDDVPMLAGWLHAFGAEIGVVVGADPRATAERTVQSGGFDLWIDGGAPVCLVGHRVAARVLRVGPVYTPPEHRNRGYGRRLTYEVTATALARADVTRAMLFTDAANPGSNSIYRQAGYEPRDRHVEIEFAERTAEHGH